MEKNGREYLIKLALTIDYIYILNALYLLQLSNHYYHRVFLMLTFIL